MPSAGTAIGRWPLWAGGVIMRCRCSRCEAGASGWRITQTSRAPTKRSAKPLNSAIVRHGAPAASTSAADVVSSIAAGPPTPDSNLSGTITDTTPSDTFVWGLPRSAERMRSRSPSSRLPMRPSSVA
jgi:hypothetical protein